MDDGGAYVEAVPNSRRALHAYVSENAHSGWHAFAARHGVSVSALLEVFGQCLAAEDADRDELVRNAVQRARELDAERRRRG